jgi:hypothetical protein
MYLMLNRHPERRGYRITKYTEGCRNFRANRINLDHVKVAES